jgi:hypothetical protein
LSAVIGGLHKIFKLICTFLISKTATLNLLGLIANRFYTWKPPTSFDNAEEESHFTYEKMQESNLPPSDDEMAGEKFNKRERKE